MAAPGAERIWAAHYPGGVPLDVEVPPLLLHQQLRAVVDRLPNRPAIRYYGRTYTYRQLWEESGRFADRLRADGIGAGDRVAIYLPNCPLYPIAFYGILRAGAIVVQISPLYLGDDLVALLRDSTPRAIVTLEILYPNLARATPRFAPARMYVGRLKEFYPAHLRPFVNMVLRRHGRPTDMPRDPRVIAYADIHRQPPSSGPEAGGDPATTVAVLQYTGGTTGRAKAAMLSHRNLIANIAQLNAWNLRRTPGSEVLLTAIPLFHIYGLTVGMLIGLAEGDAVVLQTQPDVPELLRLIQRYRPTQFPGVPALYQGLLKNPATPRYRLDSIRFCLSGSAPLPVEVQRQFEALTGARVCEGYGLSETSPATHANPLEGTRIPGSIGLPLPSTEERVVDLATGTQVLPIGEVGELCVRGPQVMLGYYRQPEETRAVLADGWFRTGDVARLDAQGYAFIVDRKKDMINVGGLKVYPREVEEVLFRHPAVADVAVVGVPDAEHGEVPKAFVVRQPGAAVEAKELIAFVREHLAHFKAPRTIEFREALPRSGVQKVLRRVLRDEPASRPPPGDAPPVAVPPPPSEP